MRITDAERLKLDAYAWPGGYPLMYLAREGWRNEETGQLEDYEKSKYVCCPKCAQDIKKWPDMIVVGQWIHYEGAPEMCEYCNEFTESAYGEPEVSPIES